MKIAFLHGPAQFNRDLFPELSAKLPHHELLPWTRGEKSPDRDIEVLLVSGEVTRAQMASQTKLALIQTVSAGYEGIDIDAANDLGIWVSFSPSGATGNAVSVAEFAVLLMLGASRHLNQAARLREHSADPPGMRPAMSGKTVCIVGLGSIGRLLVDRLRPFGMRMLATDPHPERVPDDVKAFSSEQLHTAVTEADYVVVCARAGKDNENLIDKITMQAMKRGAILINIARGSLIDEEALYDSVKSGQISAAGLDVLKTPPGAKNPLFDLPQILITPHIAGTTDLTLHGTFDYIKQVIDEFAVGEKPQSVLNAPAQPRRPLRVLPPERDKRA
jgi:phosphoglycerate dehydrogenase-like enzyme